MKQHKGTLERQIGPNLGCLFQGYIPVLFWVTFVILGVFCLYPFGEAEGDQLAPAEDNGLNNLLLPENVKFFTHSYDSLWVSHKSFWMRSECCCIWLLTWLPILVLFKT